MRHRKSSFILACLLLPAASAVAGDFVFTDVSDSLGVTATKKVDETFGPLCADFDGDGRLDLVFMNHGRPPSVYRNLGEAGFENAYVGTSIGGPEAYEQANDRHGAAAADYDGDGLVDLFIARGAKRGVTLGVKSDQLMRGLGEWRFEDMASSAGAANSGGRARGATWLDFDNDGRLDLFVSNHRTPSALLLGRDGGVFEDVSELLAPVGEKALVFGWSDVDGDGFVDLLSSPRLCWWRNVGGARLVATRADLPSAGVVGMAFGDVDNDGHVDIFLTSTFVRQNRLVKVVDGDFVVVEGDFGPPDRHGGGDAAWGDLDNDGDLDLVVLHFERVECFENVAGELRRATVRLDLPDGAELAPGKVARIALGDYDRDGRLDIAIDTNRRHYLLRNETVGGAWLQVDCGGGGFGLKLWATVGDMTVYRERLGNMVSGWSHGCGPVHFGLGATETVTLRAVWPGGVERIVEDVEVGQVLELRSP